MIVLNKCFQLFSYLCSGTMMVMIWRECPLFEFAFLFFFYYLKQQKTNLFGLEFCFVLICFFVLFEDVDLFFCLV